VRALHPPPGFEVEATLARTQVKLRSRACITSADVGASSERSKLADALSQRAAMVWNRDEGVIHANEG